MSIRSTANLVYCLILLNSVLRLLSMSMAKKTVLITGCSRGIGLGLVKSFLKNKTFNIIATCRDPSRSSQLTSLMSNPMYQDSLKVFALDTTSKDSHRTLMENLRSNSIDAVDVLIANAGISSKNHPIDPIFSCSEEDMMEVYHTNVFGTLLTLQSFSSMLLASRSRLCVVLSSRLGSLGETTGLAGYTSYRTSKAAVNMLALTYSEDPLVKSAQAKTICIHPGWVQTDMGGSGGRIAPVSVEQSADGIVEIISNALILQEQLIHHSDAEISELKYTRDLDSFEVSFKTKGCIYTAFNGEMLPW